MAPRKVQQEEVLAWTRAAATNKDGWRSAKLDALVRSKVLLYAIPATVL
jgi:hypothetical protein